MNSNNNSNYNILNEEDNQIKINFKLEEEINIIFNIKTSIFTDIYNIKKQIYD